MYIILYLQCIHNKLQYDFFLKTKIKNVEKKNNMIIKLYFHVVYIIMLTSQLVQQAIEDDSGDKFSIPFQFYASSLNNIDRLLGECIVCSGICATILNYCILRRISIVCYEN
jgi:hypothetical protein